MVEKRGKMGQVEREVINGGEDGKRVRLDRCEGGEREEVDGWKDRKDWTGVKGGRERSDKRVRRRKKSYRLDRCENR